LGAARQQPTPTAEQGPGQPSGKPTLGQGTGFSLRYPGLRHTSLAVSQVLLSTLRGELVHRIKLTKNAEFQNGKLGRGCKTPFSDQGICCHYLLMVTHNTA